MDRHFSSHNPETDDQERNHSGFASQDQIFWGSPGEQALKHVAPHRITLNPDCGFAPGSAAEVSLDEVYTKLKNEVAAAKRLREKYS